MRGITNAPQGGGSAGGEWVLTSVTKAEDIFELVNGNVVSKYDMIIRSTASSGGFDSLNICIYIPKGMDFGWYCRVNCGVGKIRNSDKCLYIANYVMLADHNSLASTNFSIEGIKITGTLGTDAAQTSVTDTLSFSSDCKVYIKQ